MAQMMFVTTAIEPATLLVSAQIRPMIVPTTSTATITASQYKIRRLVMALSLLLSRQNHSSIEATSREACGIMCADRGAGTRRGWAELGGLGPGGALAEPCRILAASLLDVRTGRRALSGVTYEGTPLHGGGHLAGSGKGGISRR